MRMVDAITAGSGDTYRIERVYLDRDKACGLAQDCNEIAPVEPVQVKEWRSGARRRPTAGRTGGGPSGGRGCRSASVTISHVTPRRRTAQRLRLPPTRVDRGRNAGAKVVHRKLTGVPKVEVASLSNEKVAETSGR